MIKGIKNLDTSALKQMRKVLSDSGTDYVTIDFITAIDKELRERNVEDKDIPNFKIEDKKDK